VAVVSGIDALAVTPDIPIVYLAEPSETPAFTQQTKAWLPAQVSSAELIAAVEAAAINLSVLTVAQAWRYLPSTDPDGRGNSISERLTQRELQVLRMLAAGLGNKEIAAQLSISDHTAKFHVAQILAKLGAGSRTEAVMTAIRRGLIPI
jgi:DNA-binding NarL/FixJ family response regulator